MVLQNTGKYRTDKSDKDEYSKKDAGPGTSTGSRLVTYFSCFVLFYLFTVHTKTNNKSFYFREESSESRVRTAQENDRIDSLYGFDRVRDIRERTGYMINMHTVSSPETLVRATLITCIKYQLL